MKLGMIELGSMGGGMALQHIEKGHETVGVSRSEKPGLAGESVEVVGSPEEVAEALSPPRVVILSLPAGETTGKMVSRFGEVFELGGVDRANSHWENSKRRHAELKQSGVNFLDAGVSGGVKGARLDACFMVGGEEEAFRVAEPIFRDLSVEGGYFRAGPSEARHFVKLIHKWQRIAAPPCAGGSS